MSRRVFPKSTGTWMIILAVVTATATSAVILYKFSSFWSKAESHSAKPPKTTLAVTAVIALGRLEPQAEIIRLTAATPLEGARIAQLLVKEGDRVGAGQVVAILDSRDRLLTALEQAKQQVKVAKTRLTQVKAGAKTGEINAQKATITRIDAERQGGIAAQKATVVRLKAEVSNAELEYQRYQKLYQEGAISASNRDSKRLTLDIVKQQFNEAKANLNRIEKTLQAQSKEAKATLNQIVEVRPVDVAAAQAEVDSANVAVTNAKRTSN